MKPALLVIDMQKQFFDPPTLQSMDNAIRYINAAIGLFREKQLPVVCVQHTNPNHNLVPGEEGFDLPDSLAVLPSDLHIHKTYNNAFNKTTLTDHLRDLSVDTVVLTGFCAEHCVLATYCGARDLDLRPIILRGALASDVPEHIRFVEAITDMISFGVLKMLLA